MNENNGYGSVTEYDAVTGSVTDDGIDSTNDSEQCQQTTPTCPLSIRLHDIIKMCDERSCKSTYLSHIGCHYYLLAVIAGVLAVIRLAKRWTFCRHSFVEGKR